MAAIYEAMKKALEAQQPVALATVLRGPHAGGKLLVWPEERTLGDLGAAELNEATRAAAGAALRSTTAETTRVEVELAEGKAEVFVELMRPSPRLVVVGAGHVTIPLVHLARLLGYRTIVVDPRAVFATRERFPHADELLVEWPQEAFEKLHLDESTAVIALSHDSKLDNPTLQLALESAARYVGAIGSRRTAAKRVEALREMGVSEEKLKRLRSPIGLKIGAVGAEEIAASIIAEIVAVRRGAELGQVGPMSLTARPPKP
jgi:xanthine dehydrogenase accessory factor